MANPNNLQESKFMLSLEFTNHHILKNYVNVVKVTGVENGKNKTKILFVAVKMVQRKMATF